jgi:hypothetical protein
VAHRYLAFAPILYSPASREKRFYYKNFCGSGPAELFALPNLTIDSRFVLIFPTCMVRLGNVNNSAGTAPLEGGLGANASW